ncbi:putative tRNA/rRNA methyltransferase YsgA [Thalassobacillus devorans]|uniref:tRNA/rRNA methyltransferase YsgA n=1 Tax=Thalassobacillus devorans TaxID=279813 RepID=A0ABQ1P8N8_9BACI|nr:RNA methyltransferase [Thalassobacillus devorans]NIK29855.1 TrmH family RNA methyltransferase [Thalassobacillus devorans]GGC93375.1 putative tRNA/rRNA methyltransferase YsgA [Thalassobacillus devorans]
MLTSLQNTRVKQWIKLKKRRDREKSQTFLVEGFHLVEEAVKSDWAIQEVIVQENMEAPIWMAHERITQVSKEVFAALADTETPQGIAAVVEMKQFSPASFRHVLLIDAVQDPGNLGTLIRTADAAGFNGVIIGKGSVDPYNDKVIRATQGSLFHMPLFSGDLKEWVAQLQQQGMTVWASALENAQPFQKITIADKAALIVGNEGAGIQEDLLELADEKVYIPIYGHAESLNVAVAAGILMYHMKI